MFKKNIMKSIIAIAAAMSLSMTAMAAGSIVGAIDMPKVSSSEGTVTLTKVAPGTYEPELQAVVDRLNAAAPGMTVQDAFGGELPNVIRLFSADGAEGEEVDMTEYKFLSPVMDLQIKDAQPSEENPVTVTFVVNNLTENIEVDVLHFCQEHQWELLKGEKISANQIAADFHSASPVALIYREKTSELGSDAVSPKTGESRTGALVFGAVAMLGIGTFAVIKRRRTV